MLRLKDRNKQIPFGLKFYLPEVKWSAPSNFPSFSRIVDELAGVIRAHPHEAQKGKWPTTREGIENWVDQYNASICASMGWDSYIVTDQGGSIPKSSAPHQSLENLAAAAAKVRELVSGAKTLVEWEDSGEPPVSRDLSTSRASVCVECPKNETGDWTKWFTVPAAELIKRNVQKAQERQMSTIHDEKLNLCGACHCPLKLKVHVPIEWIKKRLSEAQLNRMKEAPRCWVVQEINNP